MYKICLISLNFFIMHRSTKPLCFCQQSYSKTELCVKEFGHTIVLSPFSAMNQYDWYQITLTSVHRPLSQLFLDIDFYHLRIILSKTKTRNLGLWARPLQGLYISCRKLSSSPQQWCETEAALSSLGSDILVWSRLLSSLGSVWGCALFALQSHPAAKVSCTDLSELSPE